MGYKSDAQRKAVHASKAEQSPAKMKDLSGDGKVKKKDVLIGRGVLNKDGSPVNLKSPYMMYGKEMSPMTMKGGSPLAKYESSKKYNKSPLKADTQTKGMTVANADLKTLKKWKSNPKATETMSSCEIMAINARIKELSNK